MANKRWIIPLVVLVLLMPAWALRWKTEVKKDVPEGIVTWRVDRWTGQTWMRVFSVEGIEERAIGEQFEVPEAPRNIGSNPFSIFGRYPFVEEDPWGRKGLAKYAVPTDEELREYVEENATLKKNTDTYREAIAYLDAVDAWEEAVRQVDRNIQAAWGLRNGLTLAWGILSFLATLWAAVEIWFIRKRELAKLELTNE